MALARFFINGTPTTPPAGYLVIFADNDGNFKQIDENGVVTNLAGSGVQSIGAGLGIIVDDTDPLNPIVINDAPGQIVYDGVDTTANILAIDPSTVLGQVWWSIDEKAEYQAVTGFQSGDVWQEVRIVYDPSTDTFNLPETQDDQMQNIGRESFVLVCNADAAPLLASAPEVVLSIGSVVGSESFQTVTRVVASDLEEGRIFGLNTVDIASTECGKITVYGQINNIDTSAWGLNDILYVDPTTPGAITNIKPEINAFIVGKVLKVDAVTGVIFVTTITSNRTDAVTNILGQAQIFLTADEITPVATTYYLALFEDEGTTPEATELVVVPDDSIVAAAQDHITEAVTTDTTINGGLRTGQIEFEINVGGGNEKIYFEIYAADGDGVPFDPGNGQPNGDLGVPPLWVMETSLLDADPADIFKEEVRGQLLADYQLLLGNRLRVHILCEKIGAAGGDKTFTLYFGSDHDSFINSFGAIQIDDVIGLPEALDDRVKWLFPWVAATYDERTMTRIGDWTTISNKETSDYPVPQLSGDASWAIVPDPAWTTSVLLGDLSVGYDFTVVNLIDISNFRIWVNGVVDEQYLVQLYDYNNDLNPILLTSDVISNVNSSGWVEVFDGEGSGTLLPNERFRLVVTTHSTTTDANFTGNWVNVDGGAVPTAGVVTLNSTAGVKVFIDYNETGGGPDRSADLLLLGEGDNIRFEEVAQPNRFSLYRVTGASTDQTTYVEIPVELVDQGSQTIRNNQQVKTDWVVYGADTNTNYVNVPGGIPTYFPLGNVQGFITQTFDDITDPSLPLNNNLYGLDIFGETYTQSPDWDLVAFSGNTGSGGGTPAEGEANTASNIGTGEGVFAVKNGVDLEFKSLIAASTFSPGIMFMSSGDEIEIDTTGGFDYLLVSATYTVLPTDKKGREYLITDSVASDTTAIILPDPTLVGGDWHIIIHGGSFDGRVVNIEDHLTNIVLNIESGQRVRVFKVGAGFGSETLYAPALTFVLDPAIYGDLNATAWEEVGDGEFAMFALGSELSNLPSSIVVNPIVTYFLRITLNNTLVFDNVPPANNFFKQTISISENAGWVENNRMFTRSGVDLTSAIVLGWNVFAFESDIPAGAGEANTTSNEGGGEGLALAKSGVNLPFKTLIAGTNVTFNSAAQTLTINASGGGGGGDSITNLGTYTRGATQTLPINVPTTVIANQLLFVGQPQIGSSYNPATGVITVGGSEAGRWRMSFTGNILINGTAAPPIIEARILVNGSAVVTCRYPFGGNTVGNFGCPIGEVIQLAAADTLEIAFFNQTDQIASIQNSGMVLTFERIGS